MNYHKTISVFYRLSARFIIELCSSWFWSVFILVDRSFICLLIPAAVSELSLCLCQPKHFVDLFLRACGIRLLHQNDMMTVFSIQLNAIRGIWFSPTKHFYGIVPCCSIVGKWKFLEKMLFILKILDCGVLFMWEECCRHSMWFHILHCRISKKINVTVNIEKLFSNFTQFLAAILPHEQHFWYICMRTA